MKTPKKSLLILTLSFLPLVSCNMETRCFCLETSSKADYTAGSCMQVSRRDITSTAYVFCLPNNPEADPTEYTYDITWSTILSPSYFSFVDGLDGKKVDSAVLLNNNVLKIDLHGLCRDQEATHGYLKISSLAFESHTEDSRGASLYAFFAIGDSNFDVAKPTDVKF